MGPNVREFTADNFQAEVLDAGEPVLVDFWAPWCGPCRQIAPMIDELADENADSARIGKVNIDEHPNLASKYGVNSIPTLIFFQGGEPKERFVGPRPKSAFQDVLDGMKS